MSAPRPVLVVRLGHFGDFVILLGLMRSLRLHHAPAPLVLLVRPPSERLALASGLFDEVIVERGLNGRPDGPGRLWGTAPALLRRDFAFAYDIEDHERSRAHLRLHLLLRRLLRPLSPAPELRRMRWRDVMRPAEPGEKSRIPERVRSFLSGHGIAEAAPDFAPFDVPLPPEMERWLGGRPFVLLAPGSGHPDKTWPAERFGEVAARLLSRGALPVVVGTAHDREAADATLAGAPGALDLVGRTGDPRVLFSLACRAAAVIANDSGPAHLAAAAGARVVALFGAFPPAAVWAPPGALVVERGSIFDIRVEDAWEALSRVLDEGPRVPAPESA